MDDYPLEEPFFTKLKVQSTNVTRLNNCFLAFYTTNDEFQFIIRDSDCSQHNIYICHRRMQVLNDCSAGYPTVFLNSTLDILLDPRFENYRKISLGVNFINILLPHFLHEIALHSFYLVTFWLCNFLTPQKYRQKRLA